MRHVDDVIIRRIINLTDFILAVVSQELPICQYSVSAWLERYKIFSEL